MFYSFKKEAFSVLFFLGCEASAQTAITDLCFQLGIPSNAVSTVLSGPDDNPLINETVGNMSFTVEYKENVADPWALAGTAEYQMQTDANGFLVDTGGMICADFGGTIPNVSQIRIGMNVNAGEWQAPGLNPWTLDNVALSNGSTNLLLWDYASDANASFVDPQITSNGGLGDAWSGDLTSPSVTGGVLEFTFPEGGGGGGSFIYDVAAVPEPNVAIFILISALGCLGRRR